MFRKGHILLIPIREHIYVFKQSIVSDFVWSASVKIWLQLQFEGKKKKEESEFALT